MRREIKYSYSAESDAEEEYFTYRPLSNLPTPPPSSRHSSAAQSPRAGLQDGELLQPKFLGAAIHLVNLIPTTASVAPASVELVHAILSRANLPLETVALAVCLLDALDRRFSRNWRSSCPLLADEHPFGASKSRPCPAAPQLHIDSVSPEIIILAALVIAVKFTDDPQDAAQMYCSQWGKDIWSCQQLNATERCLMQNLNYRIMPLCGEELISDAMVDMQLAARQYSRSRCQSSPDYFPVEGCRGEAFGDEESGGTVRGLGLHLTPVDSPKSEKACGD